MDDEDFSRVQSIHEKYPCHSLYSSSHACHNLIGSGFEQFFSTTVTPPHSGGTITQHHPQLTKHVDGVGNNTFMQDLIVEALARQYKDDLRQDLLNSQKNQSQSSASSVLGYEDGSLFDIFSDPSLHHGAAQKKELKKHQNDEIMEKKHQSDLHVVLPKRQKYSFQIYPNDDIVRQKSSHSRQYLAKLLGNFEKLKQQYFLHKNAKNVPNQPSKQRLLQVRPTDDGGTSIEASLDISSLLGLPQNTDFQTLQDTLIGLSDIDIEIGKERLSVEIRGEMEPLGVDEEQIENVIAQVEKHYEDVIKKHRDAAVLNQKEISRLQSGLTPKPHLPTSKLPTTPPAETRGANSLPIPNTQATPPTSASTATATATTATTTTTTTTTTSMTAQPEKSDSIPPVEAHAIPMTAEQLAELQDPLTGQLNVIKFQKWLDDNGHDLKLTENMSIINADNFANAAAAANMDMKDLLAVAAASGVDLQELGAIAGIDEFVDFSDLFDEDGNVNQDVLDRATEQLLETQKELLDAMAEQDDEDVVKSG
jgi:hypothetical protein